MADPVLDTIDRKKQVLDAVEPQGDYSRLDRLQENARKYRAGEIIPPELLLRQAGQYAGAVGDVAAMVDEPLWSSSAFGTGLFGDGVSANDLIDYGMKSAVESNLGQRVMSTIQENPRLFENLGAGLNIAGAVPVLGYPFRTANKLMKNVETMVGGFNLPFYGGGKGQQGLSFIGEALEAVPDTISDMYNPQRSANVRETRLGTRRRNEIADTKEGEASAVAGEYMARQQGRTISEDSGSPFISDAPIGNKNFVAIGLNARTEKPRVQSLVAGEDIPENIANFHMSDIYSAHKIDEKGKPTEIAVARPEAATGSQISIGKEATGTSSVSSLVGRTFSGKSAERYLNNKRSLLKDKNVELTGRDYVEMAQIAGSLNKNVIREIESTWRNRAAISRRVEAERTTGSIAKADIPKISGEAPATTPSETLDIILRARLKEQNGKPLNDKETIYLAEWERLGANRTRVFDKDGNRIDSNTIADIRDFEGPIHLSTAHYSSAKALGGVRDTISIDLDSGKMYTTISDGHDMFGLDPAGGHGLVTVVPTQVTNIGRKTFESKRAKSRSKEDSKRELEEAASRLEQRSGIPRNKGENPVAYNRRVIKEYQANIRARDYFDVAGRTAELGVVTGQYDSERNQGMLTGQ